MKKSQNTSQPKKEEDQYRRIFDAASDGLIIFDLDTRHVVGVNPAACVMHGYTCDEFKGLQWTAIIHPESKHEFNTHLRALKSEGVFSIYVLDICRDGSTFSAEWHGTTFNFQGRLCLLGIIRDVTKRIQAEKVLHQRVKARTHEQTTLLEISHTLASTLELQPGLILDQLREIVEYTQGGLFALEDSSLVTLAMRGKPQLEESEPIRISMHGPETLAALFNGHRPIRIADIWSDNTSAHFLRSLLDDGAAVLLEGMQSWMWVPLAVKGRIIGGMGVAHRKRNYFTVHHANLALSVANQAAITMVNAELYEHAGELAALQERQRLAQNLHDAVNQSLFSAGLIAEVLPRLWDRDQAGARQSLEDLRRLTRGALAEMRELLAELRPSVLTDSSLGDLLRQLANAFTGRTNIPVSVTIAGEHVLPAEIQVALYRICQETLNNIAKHAGATQVEIDLQYDSSGVDDHGITKVLSSLSQTGVPQEIEVSSVEMRISDDGIGFDLGEPSPPGHYGLGMMLERAESVGAQLIVTSQTGHGTEVKLRWPGNAKKESQ
jgi:two-component system nitrate/nitrite sensor histidine kinase NarX